MQPSRRAFLLGRAASRTPWQVFCQSLRRVCAGELKVLQQASHGTDDLHGRPAGVQEPGAAPQARWRPLTHIDVRQARALCADHGILLALPGSAVSTQGRPVLWVDPVHLNELVREPGPMTRWRAGPGVTLGALARVGLRQFAAAPADRTLAAWFADRGAAAWPTGRGDLSGVHAADVLLADGVADTLGPFGADDGQPLRSAVLQQLVPALFRMASGTEALWCREQSVWPARYRLDALVPLVPAALNLAHMLHGHAGTLAWLEGLVLQVPEGDAAPLDEGRATGAAALSAMLSDKAGAALPEAPGPSHDSAGIATPAWMNTPGLPPPQARSLDRRIKEAFDPAGVFPEPE